MVDAISEDTILVMDEQGNLREVADPDLLEARGRLTNTETFEDTMMALYEEAFALLVDRQRKYGPENVRRLGFFGVFSRLSFDKIERVKRALNGRIVNGEVEIDLSGSDFADESLEDALLDIINYGVILLAVKRGLWGRPLADDVARAA